jgi:hypothetical protein
MEYNKNLWIQKSCDDKDALPCSIYRGFYINVQDYFTQSGAFKIKCINDNVTISIVTDHK